MEYRSREAIFMAILRQIDKKKGEARITEIMYKVFLSHYQLKKYVSQLIEHGIIAEIHISDTSSKYSLTDKGMKLLVIFEEMHKMVPMLDDPTETNEYFK